MSIPRQPVEKPLPGCSEPEHIPTLRAVSPCFGAFTLHQAALKQYQSIDDSAPGVFQHAAVVQTGAEISARPISARCLSSPAGLRSDSVAGYRVGVGAAVGAVMLWVT